MSQSISRRELFTSLPQVAGAAAAVAAAGVAAVAVAGCSNDSSSSDVDVLEVENDQVVTLESYTEIEDTASVCSVAKLATLDGGKILFSSDGELACSLSTGKTASPLSVIEMLHLASGRLYTALGQAVGREDGFEIYEVRCSSELLLWVESNYLTGDWRVYGANTPAIGTSISEATLLDQGDIQYDAPELAVCGGLGYWIVQPAEDGDKTSEDSYLKVSNGATTPTVAYTSHGRFNGGLSVSGNSVTAMPRADASDVYYQPTAFVSGSAVDSMTLPHSFKPRNAIYLNEKFAFDIPAGYDYGGGIANVGTYYPLDDGTWLRLTREPVTPPGMCNGWYFCKSGGRTVFVNTNKKRYFTVNPPSYCTDYGDYTIQQGACGSVYVYSTVTSSTATERTSSVIVRRINLKSI